MDNNEVHSPRDSHSNAFLGRLRPTFHEVRRGGPETLDQYADRVLFLCWPPLKQIMAAESLSRYRGQRVVYFGEGRGGCCADDAFFDLLEASWRKVAVHTPVHWRMIHDGVIVYEREHR